jgi:hypothetical protein
MTSTATQPGNSLADIQQLILFPEVVNARHLPLDRCRTTEAAQESEQVEDAHSFQQALDGGSFLCSYEVRATGDVHNCGLRGGVPAALRTWANERPRNAAVQ